jgi:thymidylate synthase ThyX
MVKIKLKGFNVPTQVLDEVLALKKELETTVAPDKIKAEIALDKIKEIAEIYTPETIAAAYARISRKPEDVNLILEEAIKDVAAARKSNESIIFGMGHHSVADHAIFNFNITDVSRLVVESIEKRRIGAGYTEKSQRYIKLGSDLSDFIEPSDYNSKDLSKFKALIQYQINFYLEAFDKLNYFLQKKNKVELDRLEGKKKDDFLKLLEGSAKEDARFGVCLGAKAQLGCSYNGEALEHAIRIMKYGRLQEDRQAAAQLFSETMRVAPSLIQLTDPELFRQHNPGQELIDDNFKYTENNLRNLVEKTFMENRKDAKSGVMIKRGSAKGVPGFFSKDQHVTMMKSADVDMNIITSLLHEYSFASIEECHELAYSLINKGKGKAFVDDALKYLSAYDKVPRAFEMSNGMMFEAEISSSGFAQLKRHRMMTLLGQDYNPELGITVPPNIQEIGMEKDLKSVAGMSEDLYSEFKDRYGKAAEYCLTNAHRRMTLVGINMRQLYHFSRTREDKHAQWEIRGIANSMSKLVKEEAPLTSRLLGGQDQFQKIRDSVYDNKK